MVSMEEIEAIKEKWKSLPVEEVEERLGCLPMNQIGKRQLAELVLWLQERVEREQN